MTIKQTVQQIDTQRSGSSSSQTATLDIPSKYLFLHLNAPNIHMKMAP